MYLGYYGIFHPVAVFFLFFSPNQFFGEVLSSQSNEPRQKKWCTSIDCSTRRHSRVYNPPAPLSAVLKDASVVVFIFAISFRECNGRPCCANKTVWSLVVRGGMQPLVRAIGGNPVSKKRNTPPTALLVFFNKITK